MMSKFTEAAAKVIENAHHLAENLGHTYIGSDHILLALAEDKDSVAAQTMSLLWGIDDKAIKNAIIDKYGCGEKTELTPRHMTPKCREVLTRAYDIAVSNGDLQIDVEHIFVAVSERRSSAFEILRTLGCYSDAYEYMMLYIFGTNFCCDINGCPVEEINNPFAKDFERAVAYIPTFVDYLINEERLHLFSLDGLLGKMEEEGYSDEQIKSFLCAWIDSLEQEDAVCTDLMDIYLYGKYTYECKKVQKEILFEDKKSFEKAKDSLHSHISLLNEIYSSEHIKDSRYDPDARLGYVLKKMRKCGYSFRDISDFATCWVQELIDVCEVFYSLMYVHLFGEHFSGESVDIYDCDDFDATLALIPDYLEYLFEYRGFADEYSVVFDIDQQLYNFVVEMEGYQPLRDALGELCDCKRSPLQLSYGRISFRQVYFQA